VHICSQYTLWVHSRSPILVPIKSLHTNAISYFTLLVFTRQQGRRAILSSRHSKDQEHGRRQRRPRRCFSPALPSSPPHSGCRPPMKLCPGPAVIIEPVAVAVAATRQFRWWSVASAGLSWLLISYVCMVYTGCLSSSSLAAIINSWRLLLCILRNLHESL